ncbi:carboxymuconolactone decarboxylase family protein [Sphingobium boeckii]|uniref:4-carboxymuconolactone decarboxylase n=1 Tax=Sphingobium boeckii TaxID=1082345 RepID=A0A7W9AI64_9SPHN|nr:carboxymuconolactone decarboxylase family protein [Sphingobium boeckii]MBB5685946.1 4-carboxymuconolactone decarboxylase [Sphingobium boeckii]
MSALLDPAERTARGARLQAELGGATTEPATPVEASWRDYIYAEIWSRPALDLRARFLIAMSSAATAGDAAATETYVRGALAGDLISLAELREAALHVAVYSGWSSGGILDAAVTRVADAMGLAAAVFAPIRAEPWDATARHEVGAASFKEHMLFGGPPPKTAYFEGGILNFVFGEMWNRAGLDERSRRWLTLVGVGFSGASTPIRSHVWSAMASGNASRAEMEEFVLQYAVHAGWPRGSVMQGAVLEQAARVEKNLPFEA